MDWLQEIQQPQCLFQIHIPHKNKTWPGVLWLDLAYLIKISKEQLCKMKSEQTNLTCWHSTSVTLNLVTAQWLDTNK